MELKLNKSAIIIFLSIILFFGSNNIIAGEEYIIEVYTLDGGEVIIEPDKDSFTAGEKVEVKALAEAGWEFVGWSGSLNDYQNPATIMMDENKLLHTEFIEAEVAEDTEEDTEKDIEDEKEYHSLDTEIEGEGAIEITPEAKEYESGDKVEVEAIPADDWEFLGWSGDLIGEEKTTELIIETESLLTARFIESEINFDETELQGVGSKNYPFIIQTLEDLERIGEGEYSLFKHYQLGSDIDATKTQETDYNNGKGWKPIGNYNEAFTGSLDGQGYQIYGLNIDNYEADNLGLFGITKRAEITNLELIDFNMSGNRYLGGLAGRSIESEISNVLVKGDITGEYYLGQLVGYNTQGLIEQSSAYGNLSAKMVAGGLVGDNNGIITNSYASTNVEGTEMLGGLVGVNGEGEVASDEGVIKNSYAKGEVRGEFRTGGLVGDNNWVGRVDSSYWHIERSGLDKSAEGQGLNTSEINDINNYKEWDFNNIWEIDNDYPKLRWTN